LMGRGWTGTVSRGSCAGGQAEPGNKRPGCVTDRDLDCDHEPPFGALGS